VNGQGWEPVAVSYENIAGLNARVFCVGDNGNEVWVGVAESTEVPGKCEEYFNIFWNLQEEMKWNFTTLKSNDLVEESGVEQVVFQERKSHASVNKAADVVYRRAHDKWEDYIFCWGKPEEHKSRPVRGGFRRCEIVFMGFQVTKVDNATCQIVMTSAFHELGNVPALVMQEEVKRISLRVSKIIARVADIQRMNAKNVQQVQQSQLQPRPQQQKVQQTQTANQKTPSVAQTTAALLAKGNAELAPLQCPNCGTSSKGSFCGKCGGKCTPIAPKTKNCNKCGAEDTGSKFCAGCGAQLR